MAKLTESWTNRSLLRREKIISSARKSFIELGFHGTGIAQIAKDATVSAQQLYRDFTNKEGLVSVVVERESRALFDPIVDAVEAGIADEHALEANLGSVFETLLDTLEPSLFLEMFAEAARNPNIALILQDTDEAVRARLTKSFRQFADATVPDQNIDVVVQIMLVIMGGLINRPVAEPALARQTLARQSASIIAGLLRKRR